MAFVDELTIRARAGKGGDGVVRWLHLKGKEYSGPSGGNGGDGGDVYLRAVADIAQLSRYSGSKDFHAGDGQNGGNNNMDGHRGDDMFIDVPRGSIVTNATTKERFELLAAGETVLVLKGGRGGAGNRVFKSSVNRSPDAAMPGVRGEEADLSIELHLIADIGLVGLPNAGKTTLLNVLTNASAKVGSYAFTTLEPNLGAFYGRIIADIPGLIEDASKGKGLGSKFLRHIARTRLLAHCVSLEEGDPIANYRTIRAELAAWGGGLESKEEIIVLTKSDCRDAAEIKEISDRLKKESGNDILTVTALDDAAIKSFGDALALRVR